MRQPFNPFVAYFKAELGQSSDARETENKARFQNKWHQFITRLTKHQAPVPIREELERTISFIGALLDLHWQDSLYEQLDGELRYENTITAVKTWLLAQSTLQPTILVIEDAQWLDAPSHELLAILNKEKGNLPLLTFITSRYTDDGRLPLFQRPTHAPSLTIELKALSTISLRQQVEDILQGPITDAFLHIIQEKTQANPFFAQQLIYYFQENDLLSQDKQGVWAAPPEQIELPASINAILIARIDRLAQRVKEVVQTAAVLGIEFELDILTKMMQDNITNEVNQAELNQIWTAYTALKYMFKHMMLREAAYNMQLNEKLTHLHLLAALAYERFYQEDLSPYFATLAYHYKAADNPTKEQFYARLAGEQASKRGNQNEAIIYFSRALTLASEAEKYDLLLLREEAYHLLGEREKQAADLDALANQIILPSNKSDTTITKPLRPVSSDNLEKQVEIILRQLRYRSAISDYASAIVIAQRAIHLARESGNLMQEIDSRYWLGEAHERQGRYEEANEQVNLGLQQLESLNEPDTKARYLKELGWIAFRQGNAGLAMEKLEEALQLVQLTGNKRDEMMVHKVLGGAANASGDYLAARQWQLQGLELAHMIGHRQEEGSLLNNLGNTSRFLGEFETAVSYHQQGAALLQKTGWRLGQAISEVNLAIVLPYLDKNEQAYRHAQNSLKISQEVDARLVQAFAWYALGNITHALKNLEASLQAFHSAITLFAEMTLPHYVIESKTGLLRLYLAQNQMEKLQKPISDILTFFADGGNIDSVEEPMRVYLTCFQALTALAHPQAPIILEQAYKRLITQASQISDLNARQLFLENNPYHQAILAAWDHQ